MKKSLLFLGLLLPLLSMSQTKLSRAEKQIVKTIRKNSADQINFLEKVVNINSGSLNLDGVREVGSVFDDAFKEINFDTKWIEMPSEMNRAGHFLLSEKERKENEFY